MTPCEESVQLGAYLLGALDPEERSALERHIAGCDRCKAELVDMAPLPGLLRHTPFEELDETAAAAESLTPARWLQPGVPEGPDGREGPGGREGREGRTDTGEPGESTAPGRAGLPPQRHRRPRRRMVSAGLVLAGAAAVAGAWVYAGGFHSTPSAPPAAAAAMTWTGQDPTTHVTATAALTPEAWGTQMDLRLGNLPVGITCHLVVHSRDGRTETAGTWGSGYGTKADVPASTSISPSDISRLDIVGGDGNVLVHVQG
ncbi:anti-sigma factor family protein [Streptacidiphilus rugosus]|uniref:anti-sigma factor family protein n=1 Tax=Streptacidiphilus rugosus TaxID=405783 RepID=UPI000560F93B|nr:zf-HC2 domain-containing protein [Streptacidiphilus rugosus]